MPKYTINGVTYNSDTPLTEAELEELGGPVAAPQPQQRSVLGELGRQIGLTARAGYEAFTSPATAVLEAGRGAFNLGAQALGSEKRIPSFYEAQRQGLTNIVGLPEAETGLERAVQAGTQAMAGTGGFAKAFPNVQAFSGDLVRQIPSSGLAGLVSQPVAEVVKDITGSDLAALIASAGAGAATAATSGRMIGAQQQKQPLYTMDQVKQRASAAYQAMDDSGVVLKPASVTRLIDNIRMSLDDARMIPNTEQAKSVEATLAQAQKLITTQGTSFSALDKMRQMLNDLKMSKDADIRRLGGVAVRELDNYVSKLSGTDVLSGKNGLDDAVKQVMSARKDWRNFSRATVLEDALNTAEARALDPRASESELIRRGFINIAADKKKMSLFNDKEQNVIKSVAKGGSLDPLLTFAAQFSPMRSKLAAAGSAFAVSQAPVTTGVVAGGGLLADLAQSQMRRRLAETAIKQIASGAVPTPQPSLANTGLLSSAIAFPNVNEQK